MTQEELDNYFEYFESCERQGYDIESHDSYQYYKRNYGGSYDEYCDAVNEFNADVDDEADKYSGYILNL